MREDRLFPTSEGFEEDAWFGLFLGLFDRGFLSEKILDDPFLFLFCLYCPANLSESCKDGSLSLPSATK